MIVELLILVWKQKIICKFEISRIPGGVTATDCGCDAFFLRSSAMLSHSLFINFGLQYYFLIL